MVDESKKRKKGSISEETISTLLRRYSVNTVISLLQEVSQVAGEKIDWHELVKKTTTGISDAREYQILWRHLAYGGTLADQIDSGQNPMDDDSDLEYELEAYPSVGREASSEAAACVKVLIASGHTIDSHLSNSSTIEAPLTISIPNSKALLAPSDSSVPANASQGINFTIPVSLQKVPSSGIFGEKRPNEATGVNVPPRRKRRCWSTKDDLKLTAAVNKSIEPDWANIARVEFNDDRKANELSQRWALLKKKQGSVKVGNNVQQPDQLAAAHRAMSMALDRPMSDNMKAASAGLTSQHLQKTSLPPPDQPFGRGGPLKPQAPTKRPYMNPTLLTPDSMVKAAAVAAGARIASSADASSLLEAARSQNVVHITTGGGGSSLMRPAVSNITSQLPSNVHFIRNGLAKAPISTYSAAKPAVQPNPAAPTPLYKSAEDAVVSTLGNVAKEVSKHNQVAGPTDMSGSTPAERVPEKKVESHVKPAGQAEDDRVVIQSSEPEDNGKKNSDKEHTSNMIHENEDGGDGDGGLPNKTVVTSEKTK